MEALIESPVEQLIGFVIVFIMGIITGIGIAVTYIQKNNNK